MYPSPQRETEPGFNSQPLSPHPRGGWERPRSQGLNSVLPEGPLRGPVTTHTFRLSWREDQRDKVAHTSHPGVTAQAMSPSSACPKGHSSAGLKGSTISQNCDTGWAPRAQTHESRLKPYLHHC